MPPGDESPVEARSDGSAEVQAAIAAVLRLAAKAGLSHEETAARVVALFVVCGEEEA